MTEQDYKELHIPHRINLLVTYRERFAALSEDQRQKFRDLDRCAKDISGVMIRTLLDELGIHLPKGINAPIKERSPKSQYVAKLTLATINTDNVGPILLEALKFGNRAVAHIENKDVDHDYRTTQDDLRLVAAITYVENKIVKHVYGTRAEFNRVMGLPNNNMQRSRCDLGSI